MSEVESFFSLTPERVLAAVEVGGRRATGYALALNSLENRVYEVELEDGERLIAKFYRPGRWSREAILDEHAFLAELAAEDLPVVPPISLDEGATLGESAGLLYALFARVRGRTPEELDGGQLEQLGRLLARLHIVGGRRPASHRPRLDPDSYGAASVSVIERGEFIPDDLRPRFVEVGTALVEECRRVFAALGGEIIRLHGDCHLGNLLWGSSGPFFLDFDDFLHGPPVQDLWLLAAGPDAEAIEARQRIAAGYRQMRAFDRRSLALVEPLRALRILRYGAWIALRWADPAFQRTFPDFLERSYWQREIRTLEDQLARVRAVLT